MLEPNVACWENSILGVKCAFFFVFFAPEEVGGKKCMCSQEAFDDKKVNQLRIIRAKNQSKT